MNCNPILCQIYNIFKAKFGLFAFAVTFTLSFHSKWSTRYCLFYIFFSDCPVWDNYMWNDVQGRLEDLRDVILKPVAMFENPFLKSPHKFVLCDIWLSMDEPAG